VTHLVKLIQAMLSPLALYVELLLVSLLLYWLGKKTAARIVFVLSFALLIFFSSEIGRDILVAPLENAHSIHNPLDYPNVKTVVVLGAGRNPESERSVTAKLTSTSITRLVEGIRVFNLIDGNNLILTGKSDSENASIAVLMRQCAIDLGVNEHKIITVDNAINTRQEARYTAEFMFGDTVFLVSSAAHLKRAVKNFEREGIFAIPIATDYQIHPGKAATISSFFPNSDRITHSGRSIHEHLGLLWEIFRR
jgi:uncharacterized SAM-binding protein YcdF (DUF218 family)